MIVSFDTSTTSTGYCILNSKILEYGNFNYKGEKDIQIRTQKMIIDIWNLLNKNKNDIDFVCAENTCVTINAKTQRYLTFLVGSIITWCVINGKDYKLYTPTQWRKLAGYPKGKYTRKELKQMAIDFCKEWYNINEEIDDVAEAILIGRARENE